ncbi:hypothetical protein [Shimia ponticola]|uniref:hypothetical protein n=1 Tax=Shimia ponticola TaxID=2582893 RepID=UPI0011BD6749|nr:hypothetical protein [Shimia ponticola]
MAFWRAFFAAVALAFSPIGLGAQGTADLFLQPQFDDRFSQDSIPKLPYGADIGRTLQPLEGLGASIGVPQGGNVRIIDVDPLANSDFGRALRAQELSNALEGAATAPGLITEDMLTTNPEVFAGRSIGNLGTFSADGFGVDDGIILNLSPQDAARLSELAARTGTLSLEESLEYQQLLERGIGNPDPGTPTQPVRWPPRTPVGGPIIIVGSDEPICDPPPELILACKYLDPETDGYTELCRCDS